MKKVKKSWGRGASSQPFRSQQVTVDLQVHEAHEAQAVLVPTAMEGVLKLFPGKVSLPLEEVALNSTQVMVE